MGRAVSSANSLAVDELVALVQQRRLALISDHHAASVLLCLGCDADVALSVMSEWVTEAELISFISTADSRDDDAFLGHALARHAAQQPPPSTLSGRATKPSHGSSEGAAPAAGKCVVALVTAGASPASVGVVTPYNVA